MSDRPTEQRTIIVASPLERQEGKDFRAFKAYRLGDEAKNTAWYRISDDRPVWSDFNVGDTIDVLVEKSTFKGRTYLWCAKISRVENTQPSESGDRDNNIMFQVCLKAVAQVHTGTGISPRELHAQAAELMVRCKQTNWAKIVADLAADVLGGEVGDDIPF